MKELPHQNYLPCYGPIPFEPGDRVTIKAHTWAPRLYPDTIVNEPETTGWVVAGVGWCFDDRRAVRLERLVEGEDSFQLEFKHPDLLVLEQKGRGIFEAGIDRPFSPKELRMARFEKFKEKLLQAVLTRYEGYRNPATFLASLHLRNDPGFMNSVLPGLVRKDGTINPNRIEKAFRDRGHRLDPWVHQSPIDVPPEFANYRLPELCHLNVDWAEVAEDFRPDPVRV
jgi:hypothetical protein